MSRTRKSNADDSLELLLDTVSNVFGGVMFLILLAALMTLTQSAIKDAPITDEADVDQSTPEMMLEFATLCETKRLQQQLLSGYQATPAAMVTLRDLAHQQIQLQEIEAAQQAAAEKSARLQTALANTSAALKRLQSEATQQRRQHRELESEIASRQANASHEVRFSRLRSTRKREAPFLLRFDRLYRLWIDREKQTPDLVNLFPFDIEESPVDLSPKPNRGKPVEATDFSSSIDGWLSVYDPSIDHITIIIWPDSFDSFETVKRELIRRHFEYRIITLEVGGVLTFGSNVKPLVN